MASTNEAPSTTRSDITTTEPEDSSNEKGTVTTEDRERKTGESAASPIMTAPRKRSRDDAKIDTVESTGKKCHRTEEAKGDEPATKCGYNTPIRTLHDNLHKFDYKMAWYTKAAEQGNATAQTYLGVCYKYGYGVSQDDGKAVEWYTKAALQGNAMA